MRTLTAATVATLVIGGVFVAADQAGAAEPTCQVITHRGLWDGTENQPGGVTYAHDHGWGIEGDAVPTVDGEVMALHDYNLARLTGGDSTRPVDTVTLSELQSFAHPFGKFRHTTALIRRAASLDGKIIVNIHRGGEPWTAAAVDELYAAAQAHPSPDKVLFAGSLDVMRARHPDATTYYRFTNGDLSAAQIVASVQRNGWDMIGLGRGHWGAENAADIVDTIRAETDVPIATNHNSDAEGIRQASSAGIRLIQANTPGLVARGCEL